MQAPAATHPDFTIYYLSEQAVTMEFGQVISEELLDKISSLNTMLHQKPFRGFCTTVPAYTTLTVYYDPLKVGVAEDLNGNDCFEKVCNYLYQFPKQKKPQSSATQNTVTIPVCYGGAFGPDLKDVASLHNISINEVIALHSNAVYKVYMIGFVPGFAYLGGMDERLATSRRGTPRQAVPAGSVGIAGQQTGVYPMETPGGWQIIGRTPLTLFNAERSQPSLLKAGDHVVFKPISVYEFELS